VVGYANPDHASTRLIRQSQRHRHVAWLLRGSSLELDVAYNPTLCHDKVVSMGIELGAQHFYIDDAVSPQEPERIADESVFHNAFS